MASAGRCSITRHDGSRHEPPGSLSAGSQSVIIGVCRKLVGGGIMAVSIHPSVDNGVKQGSKDFAGGTLTCKCTDRPVKVSIGAQVAHNHVCGCTQCWRPKGVLFSMIAVVGKDKVKVTQNGDKLSIVDPSKTIQRHACKVCGTHMFGRIENGKHAFFGLDFVHPELSTEAGWAAPGFV